MYIKSGGARVFDTPPCQERYLDDQVYQFYESFDRAKRRESIVHYSLIKIMIGKAVLADYGSIRQIDRRVIPSRQSEISLLSTVTPQSPSRKLPVEDVNWPCRRSSIVAVVLYPTLDSQPQS